MFRLTVLFLQAPFVTALGIWVLFSCLCTRSALHTSRVWVVHRGIELLGLH